MMITLTATISRPDEIFGTDVVGRRPLAAPRLIVKLPPNPDKFFFSRIRSLVAVVSRSIFGAAVKVVGELWDLQTSRGGGEAQSGRQPFVAIRVDHGMHARDLDLVLFVRIKAMKCQRPKLAGHRAYAW
jgi:hypothetical protein